MRMCLILALFFWGVFSMGDLKHSLYLKIFLWHTVSQSSAFHIISNDPVHPRDLLQLRTHDLNILVFRQSSPEETMDKAETVWQPCWRESLLFPYINNELFHLMWKLQDDKKRPAVAENEADLENALLSLLKVVCKANLRWNVAAVQRAAQSHTAAPESHRVELTVHAKSERNGLIK